MPDFADIASEYEKIKNTPDVLGTTPEHDRFKNTGTAADSEDTRKQFTPDAKTHFKLQDRLSRMFDKSSRAGAKSSLHGLILPNGRKMFQEFHDNYTGTGRFKRQTAPDKVQFNDKAPKTDINPNRVILYERCVDCCERVDLNNFIPGMIFIPPGEMLNPIAKAKWSGVDIKPGTVICYLFCAKCPTEAAQKIKEIRQDPLKSKFLFPGPGGKMTTLADKEAQEYVALHSERVTDEIFRQIKYHRSIPNSDVFYGNARIA